jgi:hypothetical protein
MRNIFILFECFVLSFSALSKDMPDPGKDIQVLAVKSSEVITVDGDLSEPAWSEANVISNFIQRVPDEGKAPTQKTEVKVLFNNNCLYIGARFYDSSPDSIIARMTRRDDSGNSDAFTLYLDPYNDKRSGYYFAVSAAGTLYDGILYNDDWSDNSWDGVWEAKVKIDSLGWVAEMEIPFSQLRFKETGDMTWGINFKRDFVRRNEADYIVFWPRTENGFVSRFAKLKGLSGIKPSKNIEILPYITGRSEFTHPDAEDPFNDGSKYKPGIGADVKMGIGSNLTLNATINPDFGQVEIDPAVINLSDVETFYSEKRPFFIEGSTIFEFGVGGARNYWGFNWPGPDFFYSRRLGRAPQGSVPDDTDYKDYPDGTHILGAAKLTGKIGDSWNVGTIQALTSREKAKYSIDGKTSETDVEPFTYYGVARVQKEFDNSRHGLGFISTYTQRSFGTDQLRADINKSAYTGGIDGWTFLDSSKSWVLAGWMGMSSISGTKERITDLQQNSQHYFQRPDSKTNRLDSSATSLNGYAGRLCLNKQKGNFFFNSALGILSPGFDVNDIGFISRADLINMHIGGGYYWEKPTDYYRYVEVVGAVFRSYDFDKNIIWEGVYANTSYEFLNYYSVNLEFAYNPETINNRRTRGGPLTINKPGYQYYIGISSDSRKNLVASANYGIYTRPGAAWDYDISTDITYRPASNISISISPAYSRVYEPLQYIDVFSDSFAVSTYGKRYVFAEMKQSTISAGIRLNWIFSPKISLQLYVQPLISSGEFTNYKELSKPHSDEYLVYGTKGSTFNNEELIADPDGNGPAPTLQVDDRPDYNYKSIRGNAVFRWEYLPGSAFYFVWTQTREDSEDVGYFQLKHSLSRLWNTRPDNIFMVKFTYWLNM